MNRLISIYCILFLILMGCIAFCIRLEIAKAAPPDKIVAPQLRSVDEANAFSNGIRKLAGKRLTLYTDVNGEEIDRLPGIFDQAFPQYCEYFRLSPDELAGWSMRGFLMKEKSPFAQTGLLPGGLPDFPHGYSVNHELWIYDQPSDYYRRHLLLHEGVHGFMNTVLGGCGPTWYMEGMAEMLATHDFKDGRLKLNYFPKNREEVPEWGRIKLIKDAFADNRAQSLRTVIDGPRNLQKETELYAWSWAAAAFLDRHPRYRDRFRELYKHVRQRDFNEYVFEVFKNNWQQLSEEWQVFIAGLEYGYDVAHTVIDFTPGKPLPEKGAVVVIAADRGWQNSVIQLQAGVKYQLKASGRYQVANQPKIWWCEPGGVSIRYYQGRPLGILLAAVRPENPDENSPSVFLKPITVGLGTTISPEQSGTLFLKINDSAAELDDNAGELRVEIFPQPRSGKSQ
jgi:hypothetical protein